MRVGLALPLALLTGCLSLPAQAGWEEIRPMVLSRQFHRAGVDPEGVLYVFAGKTSEGHVPAGDFPRDETTLVTHYDPQLDTWDIGPEPSGIVRGRYYASVGRIKPGTREVVTHPEPRETESNLYLGWEVPPGVGAPDGRIYWFGRYGPIFIEQGDWKQGTPPYSHTSPDRTTTEWLTPIPEQFRLGSATAAAPDGRIYITGGIGHPTRHEDIPSYPDPKYLLLDLVERYDPEAETWETLAPMGRARQMHAAAFGPDGKLYVFGGYAHRGAVRQREGESDASYEARYREMKARGRRVLRSVECYDPATNTWSERAPLPASRHAMGAALGADGKIYVVGGASSYSDPQPTDDVYVYDVERDRWDRGPSLIRGRFHHAVAVSQDGKIYAVGGIVRQGLTGTQPTNTVEVLDTAAPPPQRVEEGPRG